MNDKYWNILQYNNEWLRYSETKASVLLTVYGIIITIIYSNANEVFEAINETSLFLYSSVFYGLTSIISIFFSFMCINPRLKNENPSSIIYFGHIAKKNKNFSDYSQYSKTIIDNDDKFREQIVEQIFATSGIAWKKFVNVTWSIRLFVFSVIILLVSIAIYLSNNIS
ncbi:MAG: Pycsar system effector family protein [Cyclobacteriaceae bacterium]